MVQYNFQRFGVKEGRWSTFRYFYDYANGWPGDWGVHLMDIVNWAMEVKAPSGITAIGSRHWIQDNTQIPDTIVITWEYPTFVATYENRQCNNNSLFAQDYGIEFHGSDATMILNREGFQVFPERTSKQIYLDNHPGATEKDVPDYYGKAPAIRMEVVDEGLLNHVGNFLDCMRTRNQPQSDIEFGHQATVTCLLGNVALRAKEHLRWDVADQKLISASPEAMKLVTREYRAPWKLTV
jgi:predicted dehydrogenase